MARVKKQMLNLLETLSASEIETLRAKLIGPKLKALQQERATLQKRLRTVEGQIAVLEGSVPRRRRRRRVRAKAPKAAKRAPARKAARKGATIAETIEAILRRARKPMRVKDICAALVRAGHADKKSLANYVNRVLNVTPQFAKAGWGEYTLRDRLAAPAKGGKKAKAARKKRGARKKKTAAKKKSVRRRRVKKAARKAPAPGSSKAGQ